MRGLRFQQREEQRVEERVEQGVEQRDEQRVEQRVEQRALRGLSRGLSRGSSRGEMLATGVSREATGALSPSFYNRDDDKREQGGGDCMERGALSS